SIFAVFAEARSRFALEDAEVTNNGAPSEDGVIKSAGSRLDLTRVAIHDNGPAGGVTTNGKLAMLDCAIQDNATSGVQALTARIRASVISGHTLYGVYVGQTLAPAGGTLTIDNSTIHGNARGVYVNEGYGASLNHVTVANNTNLGVAVA